MILKDISFPTPQENILYDAALLELAEQGLGGEILRFWESEQPFVVLGRISKAAEDIHVSKVVHDRIPVLRRVSGGGTVLQGKGCLNYTLVLSKERPGIQDLHQSYQQILGAIIAALKALGINTVFHPLSDIALTQGNKKFSGNAQKRSRSFILHHGTLLYRFDLEKMEKYLTVPKNMPPYRKNRSHKEFVANLPSVTADSLKQKIQEIFNVSQEINHLSSIEKKCLADLFSRSNDAIYLNG